MQLIRNYCGRYYYDKTLPMCLRSSCRIFETFSAAMHWVASEKLLIGPIVHLLDDCLFMAHSEDQCKINVQGFV